MKFLRQPGLLALALGVSVAAHAALLALHFGAPEALRQRPTDPGLEVVLVNARHAQAPLNPDALAQANLDGGGAHDKGRARSPLPDMRRIEDGESVQALQRRIAELERKQQQVLTHARKAHFQAIAANTPTQANPANDGDDEIDSSRAIARGAAELFDRIEEQNRRPKRSQITPSTRQVGYALYYKSMQKRIEEVGTLNFPQQGARKLYGELVVYIPVASDGSLFMGEGGPRVERSSGNRALDQAALAIVRRAAPFGKFPANMRTPGRDDLWEVFTRFHFTREDKVQAYLGEGQE